MNGQDGFKDWLVMMVVMSVVGGSALTGLTKAVDKKIDQIKGKADELPANRARKASCERVRAVDGDTIKAVCESERVTVRMIGIDTPESKRPGVPVECMAKDAAASLKELVEHGGGVRLVQDASQDERDRYGRTLAYVEVGGRDAGEVQVRRGMARVYVYRGNRFQRHSRYVRAEEAASGGDRGIWRACGGNNHAH